MKTKLFAIVFASSFPLSTMAASVDIDAAAGSTADNTSGGSLGVGIGAGMSGSGAAVSKESDSSAAGSGGAQTAGESGGSVNLQGRGAAKGDVKAKPRRDVQTPRPPREVSVPGGASGSMDGSGAIR